MPNLIPIDVALTIALNADHESDNKIKQTEPFRKK